MFKQLKNIDTAFKHIRLFSFVLIGASVAGSCFIAYQCLQQVERTEQRIYVLSNGKLLEAIAADRKDNIAVELRDHIRSFHYYFFTVDPDEAVINRNISKALYLADGSAKTAYDNLKENSYYANIVSGNVSQRIEEDSILVNMNQVPYHFRYYGKQKIIRPTAIVLRSISTEGYLREVTRSDHNPHGYLIERWKVLNNQDLQIQKR